MSQALRDAMYFLEGLENGNLPAQNVAKAAEPIDPLVIYLIFKYLRERYPASQTQGAGVVERLVGITTNHPELVKKAQKGEKDPLREWFEESYSMREFFSDPEKMLEMVLEKIDS